MASKLIFDTPTVFEFVNTRVNLLMVQGMVGIGLERDGKLIAGVIYESRNDHTVWMHVAALPGCRWMTKEYLRTCFAYPFLVLGVKAVRGYVMASNAQARQFDEHLGFKPEATLEGAGADGGDVIIYRMWRHECRFLNEGVPSC